MRQCLCTKAWTASVYFIHRRDPGEVVRCRSLACPSMPPQGISGRNLITTEVASGTPILRRYSFPTSGDTTSGGNDITARYSESPPLPSLQSAGVEAAPFIRLVGNRKALPLTLKGNYSSDIMQIHSLF